MAYLEHANITVKDPKATAALLSELFGWHTRWEGHSANGIGYSVHVGSEKSYVALYTGPSGKSGPAQDDSYATRGAMNHIGVVVDDLDPVLKAVEAKGYETYSHADYEPGQRFYFAEDNGIEIEVVSYA